jgi:hypothetical protein
VLAARPAAIFLALVLAGCLSPRAEVVPGAGGAACGQPFATWTEPGIFRALSGAGAESQPGPSIPLRAPSVEERWPGARLNEVYVSAKAGHPVFQIGSANDAYTVRFSAPDELSLPEKRALFERHLASVAPAAVPGAFERLGEEGQFATSDGRFTQYRGVVRAEADATSLFESFAGAKALPSGEAGTPGWATLSWEATDEEGRAHRTFFTFRLPVRSLELPVRGGEALMEADSRDRVSLSVDPALLGEPDDATRSEAARALVRLASERYALPTPGFAEWNLLWKARDCGR